MIDRRSVIDYLNKHPSHSTWQMRQHFLQASRQENDRSPLPISTIVNQLNYILRDLEVTGKIPPRHELAAVAEDARNRD